MTRLSLFLWFALAGTGIALAQAPSPPTSFQASTPPVYLSVSGLHVVGNQILNGSGQAVPLKGVNVAGASYNCQSAPGTPTFDGPTTQTAINALLTWGINIVRIPVNQACWLGINGQPTNGRTAAQYQSDITTYINLLNSNGLAAILDLQYTAPGTNTAQNNEPMPDADHSGAFWTSAAGVYKTNSSVIFDLFNEPWPDSNSASTAAWTCVRDGGTCPGVSYTAVGMQTLINNIRATGSTNIVMVPGVQFENTLDQWLTYEPTDSANEIVASWHSYTGEFCSAQSCWTSQIAPVLASVPLIAGEIGETDCGSTFINELMDWMDAHGGNYTAWSWATYDCSTFPALISDYTGTPTGFGVGFRNHLLALTGQYPPATTTMPVFSNTYPYGIWFGASTTYTASDGTVYYPDVTNTNPGLVITNIGPTDGNWVPFTTTDTITGTSDPTLFKTERWGNYGFYYLGVPNGNYTVTFGAAPNSTHYLGSLGQNQLLQGTQVGSCIWSSNPGGGGGQCGAGSVPTLDVALTASYTVNVTTNQLAILPEHAGDITALSFIKVVQNSLATIPPVPIGFTGGVSGGNVTLSWTASAGAQYYKLLRAISTLGAYEPIAAPEGTSYSDTAVTHGTTYCYYIAALNGAGSSANSSQVCETP